MPTPRTRLGNRGEGLAREYLEQLGYSIQISNYRCTWGEMDIVAREGEELVFVEVRTRRGVNFGAPEESITSTKARRLIAIAQEYLQEHNQDNADWRIDLIGIRMYRGGSVPQINHLRHAVQL